MSGTQGRGRPTRTAEREPATDDAWGGSGGLGGMVIEGEAQPLGSGGYPMAQPAGGMATDRALAQIVTAQRVAVKRRQGEIRQSIALAAQAAGSDYFYRWEVNNRGKGTKDVIEGISITGTMAVARIYGNCAVRCVVAHETATHWTMAAEFVDYETGFTSVRQFQQRKNQNVGMKDQDRASDMVFQIAQSKAIRNVIRNVLGDLCEFALEEAKRGLLAVVERDPAKAKNGCIKLAGRLGIDGSRIERAIGRALVNWTVHDIAACAARLRSIEDGFAMADDLFPSTEQAEANMRAEDGDERPMPQAKPVGASPVVEDKAPAVETVADEGPDDEGPDDEGPNPANVAGIRFT